MSTQYHAIAIDGPSGAGKSTLSQQLARALGYLHVDTGAIYRTVGLAACRRGISMEDRAGIEAILPQLDIRMRFGLDGCKERTQREVADELGISQSYISRLEKRIIKRLRGEISAKM